jgi:hypothetical protein
MYGGYLYHVLGNYLKKYTIYKIVCEILYIYRIHTLWMK